MYKQLISLTAFCTGLILCAGLSGCGNSSSSSSHAGLAVNDSSYFETRGLNFFVFSNMYDATFDDSKISAVEVIHHGVRTATNGDVRLNPTPGQWDALPKFVGRIVDKENNRIDVQLQYPDYGFSYTLRTEVRDGQFYMSVYTEQALPESLIGVAGLNLELFPPVFFGKSYMLDGKMGLFPVSPADSMTTINGQIEPTPMATGHRIEIAPDDPGVHLSIQSTDDNPLMLFDGRNKQQNGTFVVRTLLPAGKTGKIAEWNISAEIISGWTRQPVISHSQVGYHPNQKKTAVVELDKNDSPLSAITLWKVQPDGSLAKALSGKPVIWGTYTRYNYLTFDFSPVKEPGIYLLEYGTQQTAPFPIANDVYARAWYPTMDVFFPVQMDHMFVREAYRVWHGAPHLDDALQAPLNRIHWDGWRQGPVTGNKYKPLEHIPGLNVGGWFDAGDFDIQTPSQHTVVQNLTAIQELFNVTRDETTIIQETRYVDIHVPDGTPDIIQQIEHGVLQLVAQVKAIGYAINGINESHLYQYRHLGDAVNKTDNLVYNPRLDSLQTDGRTSGTSDDRWAFTGNMPFLNYGTAISVAAAARVLRGYNDTLSAECIQVAEKIWMDEHNRPVAPPDTGRRGFLNGAAFINPLECRTAFELWRTTDKAMYKARLDELLPEMLQQFNRNAYLIATLLPYMDDSFKQQVEPLVKAYVEQLAQAEKENPYGVSIDLGGWAGNRAIIQQSITCFLLYKSFLDLIDTDYIFRGLNYIYGCHPFSSLSFVSGVGAQPKKVAYGSNRADYTFIPGGIVPGVRILKPDFPENRDDYPFLWSENEYVIDIAASYIFLVKAVNTLLY
ncbi:MAG: glycoside hydrolase family 9 protein [Tannerellaceae bacterium]|jgi:hypothetical protein|nr:glycoside hydrolase family 9 protein [Tannerellaceae bacterium]